MVRRQHCAAALEINYSGMMLYMFHYNSQIHIAVPVTTAVAVTKGEAKCGEVKQMDRV